MCLLYLLYMENLDEYKKNHKTAYLAEMYEKLQKDEVELLAMANDPSMKELADADLTSIFEQKKTIERHRLLHGSVDRIGRFNL